MKNKQDNEKQIFENIADAASLLMVKAKCFDLHDDRVKLLEDIKTQIDLINDNFSKLRSFSKNENLPEIIEKECNVFDAEERRDLIARFDKIGYELESGFTDMGTNTVKLKFRRRK